MNSKTFTACVYLPCSKGLFYYQNREKTLILGDFSHLDKTQILFSISSKYFRVSLNCCCKEVEARNVLKNTVKSRYNNISSYNNEL